MTGSFILELEYNNEKKVFDAQLNKLSRFTHRMMVNIDGTEVWFEPDEERHYRALMNPDNSSPIPDRELLQAVARKLHELFQF